jgi:hypothetical protein
MGWKVKTPPKIGIPKKAIRDLDDFLALIFDDGTDNEYVDRRITIAKTLMMKLRAGKKIYREDWLEIVLESMGLYDEIKRLHTYVFGYGWSKTNVNRKIRKEIAEKGININAWIRDYYVVIRTLKELNIISYTSNRINLTRPSTFRASFEEIVNFYTEWRLGDAD